MRKAELIELVRKGYEDFQEAVASISTEAMVEPGVVDDWSLKDLIAHVSQWKAEVIRLLWYAQQNETPTGIIQGEAAVDKRNEELRRESQARTADQVLADYHGVSRQLIKRLEAFKDNDFGDPNRWAWLEGVPLEVLVADNSYEHEREHSEQIAAWREKCL